MASIPSIDDAEVARFWARVERTEGCWFYTVRKRVGYGRCYRPDMPSTVTINGRSYPAHQLAYTLAYGEIPKGIVIRHRCAMGGCVNPSHLILGTRRENNLDRYARIRAGSKPGQLFTYEDE